jgi:transcriptional regulator with XRE-family HTH domain
MKERLIQLLDLEQLSPSKFADLIGVQRSSISHIISGRNKPSFDFLQKTLKAFPGLNASWLLMGEGTMYEHMGRRVSGNLFDTGEPDEAASEEHISADEQPVPDKSATAETKTGSGEPDLLPEKTDSETDKPISAPDEKESGQARPVTKRIVQVMLIYEDDTFKTVMPAH